MTSGCIERVNQFWGAIMKMLFAAALAAVAIVLAPGNVSAQSNDAILRRLEVLEKENTALRDRVHRLEAKNNAPAQATAATASSPAAAYAMVAKSPSASPAMSSSSRYTDLPVDWSGVHIGAFSGYALGHWAGTAEDYPHQPVNG